MARPREFDQTEALERARDVFWQRGYEGSSLADLLEATDLSKSSLYETFGDKRQLFLAALSLYQDQRLRAMEKIIETARPGLRIIEELIRTEIAPLKGPWGCMVCNTAVELAPSDPEIAKRIAKHYIRIEEMLCRTIQVGQSDGSIGKHLTAGAMARFFVAGLNGLQVLGRAKSPRVVLEDAMSVMLSALK